VVGDVFIFCSYHIRKAFATTPNRALSRHASRNQKKKATAVDAVAFLADIHVLQKYINTLTEWLGLATGLSTIFLNGKLSIWR
jgi:hypothetical protein